MSTELQLLKERATRMGIPYSANIGLDTLKERIKAKTESGTLGAADADGETVSIRNTRLRKEANKLVRVQLTCLNPAKKNWPGEIISVSNSAIGVIKKMIPFEAEDGYHIPMVLLGVLGNRKFQQFYTVKENGIKVKKSRLAKEFAIEILDDLSIDELQALANRQAHSLNAE